MTLILLSLLNRLINEYETVWRKEFYDMTKKLKVLQTIWKIKKKVHRNDI